MDKKLEKKYIKWKNNKREIKAFKQKENTSILLKILLGIVLLIVVINYIKIASGNNTTMGLQTFIQSLQTISNTYITLPNLQNLTIIADWGVFNFLRDGINTTINIFNVALFVANTLLNLIIGIMAMITKLIF